MSDPDTGVPRTVGPLASAGRFKVKAAASVATPNPQPGQMEQRMETEAEDALVAAISAINEGVAEILITGADRPSINASLRVGRSVRKARASGKDGKP